MLHRIIISSFGLLTLAMCQTQHKKTEVTKPVTETTTTASTPKTKVKTSTASQVTPGKTAANSTSASTPAAKTNANSSSIYLTEGQNIFVKDLQMNVTFKKMLEDSRCPKDVNCIWQGVATAEIELMGTATRPRTYRISSLNMPEKGLEKDVVFDGYQITLNEITPHPTQSQNFKSMQGKYKIGLTFKKVADVDPTVSRGGATTK